MSDCDTETQIEYCDVKEYFEEQLDELHSCIAVARIQNGAPGFKMDRHRLIRFFLSLQQGATSAI